MPLRPVVWRQDNGERWQRRRGDELRVACRGIGVAGDLLRLGPVRPSTGRRSIIVLLAGVAGCGYHPGSFRAPLRGEFAGEQATAGCLDVAIAARTGMVGTVQPPGQVVEVTFANRCDRPAVVDFPAMRTIGRDAQDNERSLMIYDPQGTLRPLTLEARTWGKEVIELRTAVDRTDPIHGACLDVGGLARDHERWVCLAASPAAVAVSQ